MLCHILRLRHDSLLNLIIEGYVDDKTWRGSSRMESIPQLIPKDTKI